MKIPRVYPHRGIFLTVIQLKSINNSFASSRNKCCFRVDMREWKPSMWARLFRVTSLALQAVITTPTYCIFSIKNNCLNINSFKIEWFSLFHLSLVVDYTFISRTTRHSNIQYTRPSIPT